MEDIERTYELDEYLKLLSNASMWEGRKSVERFHFFDGNNWIHAKASSEVIDFLQPYEDDIVNMAVADEVVVCHGYNLENKLTTEEELKGCKLPQSLWDLKEKYNCCIEFIHCFVYFACEDIPEIRCIHMTCVADTFEDPYFIWTASKDIAVREIYISNVSLILANFWDLDLNEQLSTLDYMEEYVCNEFNDELSEKWVKYTFNTYLLRNYIFASPFFHLYDNKDFDERIELIKKSIIKTRLIGRNGGEAITYYYNVIDMIVNDTKEYLLEGKEIVLTRVERHEYIGDWQFEGNHWLRFLGEHCDLEEPGILYKAFLDYVILDKRFGVREAVEKDRHGNDVKKIIYYMAS